jgi:hypothetical protein
MLENCREYGMASLSIGLPPEIEDIGPQGFYGKAREVMSQNYFG